MLFSLTVGNYEVRSWGSLHWHAVRTNVRDSRSSGTHTQWHSTEEHSGHGGKLIFPQEEPPFDPPVSDRSVSAGHNTRQHMRALRTIQPAGRLAVWSSVKKQV